MDFAKAYRACKRTQALPRGLRSVEACLERDGAIYIKVEEAKVDIFWPIHGYKITTLDGTAFFPRGLLEVPKNSGLSWMREVFLSADIVLPPYYGMGFLSKHAAIIKD